MKIAQVAPLFEAVPPKLYGGTERVVANLCNALVDLGHDVTLFASAEANTRARLVAARDQALRLDPDPLTQEVAAHLTMLDQVRQQQDRFDIIHFHTELLQFPMFEDIAGRTLTTLHYRLDLKDLPAAFRRWSRFPLVAISESQRAALPFANWAGTVHHGMAKDQCRFSAEPRGYLAFLGRMSVEKGPDRAIEIATRLGMPLKMAAKVGYDDVVHFKQVVEPLLDNPLIDFIGEIGEDQKSEFLGGAEALLFPIDWPEPFGLVMIEAMACGTPVIAFDAGAAAEVIDHGVTGFVVKTVDEAIEAVQAARHLDRREIRKRFDRRFTATAMARAYLDLYAERLARQPFAAELAPEAPPQEEPPLAQARLAKIA